MLQGNVLVSFCCCGESKCGDGLGFGGGRGMVLWFGGSRFPHVILMWCVSMEVDAVLGRVYCCVVVKYQQHLLCRGSLKVQHCCGGGGGGGGYTITCRDGDV